MCGITGKIKLDNRNVSEKEILLMNQRIKHRGPDDSGVYLNGPIGLGSVRLSVIDLSSAGHMPMISEDKQTIIVYNGEIYDTERYRRELSNDGIKFKSKTDTEIILYLYKKYGIDCLSKLRGMFSFVIYDKKKNILFGARDRFGEKPLKYFWDQKTFIFSSELKAILENKEVEKKIDYFAINDFLTYQYVPYPKTGFKNIYKLPPAHYFILDLEKSNLEIKRYWDLDYSKKLNLSENEWKKIIFDELENAVKMRMVSDVPLGAFLSGGVDSSAIVAMMARNSNKPIKTFSIGFKENKFDERHYAQVISKIFQTDHHELIVSPEMMIESLPTLIRAYEEPYGDSSMLPTYYLAKLTKEQVTVALNGDGGDENFMGYSRYKVLSSALYFNKTTPLWFKKSLLLNLYTMHKIIPSISTFKKGILFLKSLEKDIAECYLYYIGYFMESNKKNLYKPEMWQILKNAPSSDFMKDIFDDTQTNNTMDKALYADFNSYLPEDLMVKVDIATMQHSLESRAPMLDHKFVETISKIPSQLKLKNGISKYIFKKSLENILPEEILYRKKMGFGIPVDAWFRGPLKNYVSQIIINESRLINQIMKREALEKLFDENTSRGGRGRKLWLILCLELWYREYFN